jgi:hypothetical protein
MVGDKQHPGPFPKSTFAEKVPVIKNNIAIWLAFTLIPIASLACETSWAADGSDAYLVPGALAMKRECLY